ncbi:trypsin-like serine peptidase [Pseudomonas moraviensis]|uniref:trypsin-like serine peptidase n=1 Tax=Pseudomonas moraviensis TaxID=321662 RepID=UPI000935DFE6|nr:trypsin-like peptidase domain-containing protein [Pseudomonas moraviensis]OJT52937.1 serine protease [Pseudomonas moraviensis]
MNIRIGSAVALIALLQGCASVNRYDWGEGAANFAPAERLANANGRYAHWQAIGRVEVEGGMTCSGTLIDTREPGTVSNPAYVLTSGHCTHPEIGNNEVIVNQPAKGRVTFNYFFDTQPHSRSYAVGRIGWSTLRGQDISIVELATSLEQLISDGIEPLKLAHAPLPPEENILITGAPVNGFIQRMACKQEHSAAVIEGPWRWVGQSSNRCLDVVSGLSGSPLLARYTNEVVGVLGTTTRGSDRNRCDKGAPCEVIAGQVNKRTATNYASTTEGLGACFTKGRFDPRPGDCPLGAAWSFPTSSQNSDYIRVERDEHGQVVPWHWLQTFALSAPYYRYRYTRTLDECQSLAGYSQVQTARPGSENQLSHELKEGAGLYFLCLIGQQRPTDVPKQSDGKTPSIYWRWLLEAPAPLAPAYKIEWGGDDDYDVRVFPVSPDLDPFQFQYKSGQPGSVNCNDGQGFQRVPPSTGVFHVSVANGRQNVCLKGADLAGNPGPTIDFLIPQ